MYREILLAGAVVLILAGCGESAKDVASAGTGQQTGISMSGAALYKAQSRALKPSFKLPALVEAKQNAKIRPEVQAPVKVNHFQAGDLVSKGDLLVELVPAKFEARLDAAKAQLKSAEANAVQARTAWQRAQNLMPKGHISAMDYDKARAEEGISNAAVAQAEAGLARARLDLSQTRIHAPFDGKISKPGHAVGSLVGPLAVKPLFELVQLDPIYVTTEVALNTYNDFVALRLKAEQQGVEIPELVVYLELSGGTEYPLTGTFQSWSHSSAGSSGTIAGRVLFSNPQGLLLPGQNVILRGEAAQVIDRIVVPQKAVMQDQQGHYVKVLDDDNMVQRRNIETGIRSGADWAVRSGLEVGERVIVAGAQGLKPGTQVTVND